MLRSILRISITLASTIVFCPWVVRAQESSSAPGPQKMASFVEQHCLDCHSGEEAEAGLRLEPLLKAGEGEAPAEPPFLTAEDNETWEKVVRKLRARQMPPADWPRPDESEYVAMLSAVEGMLDRAAQQRPNPGRTATFRRLTRTEYQNAIRDLLAVEIDTTMLLPSDEASHGFDNVTVGTLSPTLMNRYVSAAQHISRLAVGASSRAPAGDTFRVAADQTQEEHVAGLPLGTRGGILIPYTFPQDGKYEVQIRLTRDRDEHVEGLSEPHELEVLLDRDHITSFTVKPPKSAAEHQTLDANLKARFEVTAGPHDLGVTFAKKPSSLLTTKRQPYEAHFNMYRHPRISPAIYEVSIMGPFDGEGPGDTPSRDQIFACRSADDDDEDACAREILTRLARRAYRRPVSDEDLQNPLEFYRHARAAGEDFDTGIEKALSALLVSPHFLFRIEADPPGVASGTPYHVSDIDLASRLSFFLWSSIPDDELLDLAERNELSKPEVLEDQVRRMLADPRAEALAVNFAGQWLYLRNLDSFSPDLRLFPDFDDNLRQAFRRETELLFQSILQEDRSVLDLLRADYTYVNERLAKHYGIPHVYGSRFRRVPTDEASRRGGLLRHGSILSVTSYATRTSPVIRGNWVLENLLGTPAPPPPANVPALTDNTVNNNLTVRERLAEHRANEACAVCHQLMDPVGFALEHFDAVGRWREYEAGRPVDASGGLPDGSEFTGVTGLEQALLERPELLVGTITEKLLTYALGRGIEHHDGPAIRQIVRQAEADDYRFSSLILAITASTPFQMRMTE